MQDLQHVGEERYREFQDRLPEQLLAKASGGFAEGRDVRGHVLPAPRTSFLLPFKPRKEG